MKKLLPFLFAAFAVFNLSAADKIWNFSELFITDDDNKSYSGTTAVVENELLCIAGESTAVDNATSTSMKKWTTGSYHTRFKTGGAGDVAKGATLAFKVAGNSTIQVCAVSSSGSAVRKLVAATSNGTIIGSELVDGNAGKDAEIAPPTFNYTGGEAIIYIFSAAADENDASYASGGINFYMVSATNATTITVDEISNTPSGDAKTWDFSVLFTTDNDNKSFTGTTAVVENELICVAGESTAIDNATSTSMKKWTTGSYHTRFKTGGAGDVGKGACMAFKVVGNSTIQVCAVSSSGSAVRKLVAATSNGTIIGSELVDGNAGKDATIDPPTFNYTGGKDIIYIYSAAADENDASYASGGINFYMISATNVTTITLDDLSTTSINDVQEDLGAPIAVEVYSVTGAQVATGTSLNAIELPKGIYVVKSIYEGGKTSVSKIAK